jgi:hypothetical protein
VDDGAFTAHNLFNHAVAHERIGDVGAGEAALLYVVENNFSWPTSLTAIRPASTSMKMLSHLQPTLSLGTEATTSPHRVHS